MNAYLFILQSRVCKTRSLSHVILANDAKIQLNFESHKRQARFSYKYFSPANSEIKAGISAQYGLVRQHFDLSPTHLTRTFHAFGNEVATDAFLGIGCKS